MATKNPRVVGYVSLENHTRLKEFVEKHSLTESKAIDVILSQFFSATSSSESSIRHEVLNRVILLEQQIGAVMGESVA